MSGLPILLVAGTAIYLMNRETVLAEQVQDNTRKEKEAQRTIKKRNKQVRETIERQDKPDEELRRRPKDRAGNNDLSGQNATHDSLPNEQTEPIPAHITNQVEVGKIPETTDEGYAEKEEPDGKDEPQKFAVPDSEYETQTLKDNGKISSKRGTGGTIN